LRVPAGGWRLETATAYTGVLGQVVVGLAGVEAQWNLASDVVISEFLL
jgi:hypothetical protein